MMFPSYLPPDVLPLLNRLLHSDLSFAAYRCPDGKGVRVVASEVYERVGSDAFPQLFERDGFVWAPFDVEKHPVLFIPNQNIHYDKIEASLHGKDAELDCPAHFSNQTEYNTQVAQLVNAISPDGLQKAILSRILPASFNCDDTALLFVRLCEMYPNAYVYCVRTPYSGLWIGATPELFLHKEGDEISTVALAGTRRAQEQSLEAQSWHIKEKDEQAIVADYIANVLNEQGISSFERVGPVPVQAGQVSHLKTTFRFRAVLSAQQLSLLVLALHPTPAVAGLPKLKAMSVIASAEKHDRAYYGGFLGRLNEQSCQLYVTLRCMRVVEKQAFLFVGGGITKQSDPIAEWDETVLKSQTLLSVLKNI